MLFSKIKYGYLFLLSISIALCLLYKEDFIWLALFLSVLYVFLIIAGSFFMNWGIYGKAICRLNEAPHGIVLTFDDGPHPVHTPEVLAVLKKHGAKAIFFCIGKHIEQYPDVFRQIVEEGHRVGNHSYSHPRFHGFLGTDDLIGEIKKTELLIIQYTGSSAKLYRPPFGVTNPIIGEVTRDAGLTVVGWSVRSLDTIAKKQEHITSRLKHAAAGDIVLFHDTIALTPPALDQFLFSLHEKGLSVCTLNPPAK